MIPNVRIDQISLINFRNHLKTNLSNLNSFIVLNGSNGSGKTNILEAISLFAPGRGIKNSNLIEMINKKNNISSFQIKATVKYVSGEVELTRSYSEEKNKNYLLVDDEKISNTQLLDFLNILWITPIMEKVMLQSHSEKRNFFDRLIFNTDKNHIKIYSKLQKMLSERLALIKSDTYDENWMNILENNISNLSHNILKKRVSFINKLNDYLTTIYSPFSQCSIEIRHEILGREVNILSDEFIENYKNILKSCRKIDKEIGKTSQTINRVKIQIYNSTEKLMEAKNCSTGEQKSILLSIFLSVANMIKEQNSDRSPIILIDEAMAHLDRQHKEYLFSELTNLNSQVWFSGVSKELFENINHQTVFFEMKNII